MTRAELIQYITDNVYPNARNEVTAPMVRDSLLEIVDFLGDAATYNIGMVASGNQGLVTGGNVNTAIALALLPYYTAVETGQAIDDAIARIGLGQAAYKNIGQVAENNTDLVTGGQVYTAINTALTSAIKFQGISDTPLTDGSTTNPIQIDGQSYTAKKGDMVVYGGNEFLWVGNKWQQMGDESSYALKTVQITGTGYLTGGGDLTQSRTLDISATAKGYIDHGEAAYNYFPGGVLDSTHLPSMYIGTTSVQFTAAAQNLTGISSVRATSNVLTLFEWDVTNSAWHFHGNIYTDGWFSGGGISSGGGGGGGGIDPVAMWRLLTNDPSLTQYDDYTKISADHINFPVTSVVGLGGNVTAQQIAQALNLGSFAYKNSLSTSDIPDLSGTYATLSTAQTITNWKTYSGEVGNAYKILRKAVGGGGWAYTPLRFTGADDVMFFNIGAYGQNTTLTFAFVGCNDYNGLNLRISPSTLSWGSNAIYHAGNFVAGTDYQAPISAGTGITIFGNQVSVTANTFAPYNSNGYLPLNGGTMLNTNVVLNLNADLLDGLHEGNFFKAMNFKTQPWKGGIWADYSAFGLYPTGDAGYINVPQWSSNGSDTFYTSILRFPIWGTMQIAYVTNNTSTPTWYTFYHSGNSNKSDVAWACSDLNASGVIHATTGIYTDGWFSGGGVASSSDRRLKKNIKNFAYTPKLLLAIRPREWDWKDGSAMVGHAAGFVAQEIEPIMPYAVDGTRNFKALFYDRFHALEIAGLQDHERRIVELEQAVKERDEKIEKLEKMLKLN